MALPSGCRESIGRKRCRNNDTCSSVKTPPQLATSMAVQLDSKNTMIIDHGSYQTDLDDGTHTKVIAGGVWNSKPFIDGSAISKVCFSGVGASLVKDNQFAHKILWGSKTSYSHRPEELLENTPAITGEDAVMVAALQTR